MSNMSGRSFEVAVIVNRCKGCRICISMCPKKVLEQSNDINDFGYNYAYPKNIDECIGCKFCEIYCPDFAIYVKPSDKPKATLNRVKKATKVVEE
ncbi:MAG: 4Fe-4S binding protein [Candidatus Methanomethylicia archaeon]